MVGFCQVTNPIVSDAAQGGPKTKKEVEEVWCLPASGLCATDLHDKDLDSFTI